MSNLDFDSELDDSFLVQGGTLLLNYGWYFVGLGIFYLVFKDKINKTLDTWYERWEDSKYAAKYHKNPDLTRARMEGLENARQKMQEDLNKKAVEAQSRKKELEEKKRLELLNKYTDNEGHRLGQASTSKNTFRSEYNPLMNDSGSRYKPPKRSCCKKGGGCG